MATAIERLRMDLGLAATDTTNLSDATAQDIIDEAGESYTDATSIYAASRVIALRRLRAESASSVDYDQNNSSEKASQRFKHLGELLAEWEGYLGEAVAGARTSAARFGRTTRRPARIREYPGW